MKMWFRWRSSLLLLAIGLMTAQPTLANHAFPYLREKFGDLQNRFDLRLTHSLYMDTLSHSRGHTLSLSLVPGVEYVIAGLCDERCRDMDLRLYSPTGNLMRSDTTSDDYP